MSDEWKEITPATSTDFVKWTAPGTEVIGVWQGAKQGKLGPLGAVKTAEGVRVFFPLAAVLSDQLKDVTVGTRIKIVYRGETLSKSGFKYKIFVVFEAQGQERAKEPEGGRLLRALSGGGDDLPF